MSTSRRAASFAAGLVAPATFDTSLMPRTPVQQGLVTGLSSLATYGAVRSSQAIVQGLARSLTDDKEASARGRAIANLATLIAATGAHTFLRRRDGESLGRAALRTASYEVGLGAGSALGTDVLRVATPGHSPVARVAGDALTTVMAGVAATILDIPARRKAGLASRSGPDRATGLPAVAAATAVTGGVLLASSLEQAGAHALGKGLARVLPGPARLWATIAQVTTAGALAVVAKQGIDGVLARIEQSARDDEAGIDTAPQDRYVSGGPDSGVDFAGLTREGRRHVLTRVRPDVIEDVMLTPAIAEPVRVFVGLDTAPTIEDRVAVALSEMDRLGAFERSILVLISPTGSGYVNYAALQAVELLGLGDVASVVMQYSFQPSFLSLDHVALGRAQNSMLWHAIARRLEERPAGERPRLLLFGESLGAHTSQDVFIHLGTAGLDQLGVSAAVWIGTPFASTWKDEVLGPDRPDTDRSSVGVFTSFADYTRLPEPDRAEVRFAMITHDEDGVPKFGWPVAIQEPDWIRNPRPGSGTPTMRWRPFTTFVQVFVDMLNGSNVTPGEFASLGHDYRGDLLPFVSAIYRLPASDEQMARVAQALPRMEAILFDYLEGAKQPATSD